MSTFKNTNQKSVSSHYPATFSHKLNIGTLLTHSTDNQEYFLDLVNSLPSGIIIFDKQGTISMASSNAIKFLNISKTYEEIKDTHILNLLPKGRIKRSVEKSISEKMTSFTIPYIAIDHRYLQIIGKCFREGMLIAIQDITINNRIKDAATKSLLQGQEMERSRISREMHDGIGPLLSSIKLRLDAVRNKMADQNVLNALIHIDKMIVDTSKEIRAISHALMPSSLSDFGLEAALKNLLNNSSNPKTSINLNYKFISPINDGELELHIYRIIQELIQNSLKHSDAALIDIKLSEIIGSFKIQFSDNGIGFDTSIISNGLGLTNIKNRVQILGGNFEIQSSIGTGVQIEINLPSN